MKKKPRNYLLTTKFMENDIQRQIEERLGELPEDVRLAILSSDFEKKVHEVGKVHGLHIDQIEALGDETMLVMLGFSATQAFADNIQNSARVSRDEAHKMAAEVSDQVFLPIRESMKKFMAEHAERDEKPATQIASTPAPTNIAKPTLPPVAAPSLFAP